MHPFHTHFSEVLLHTRHGAVVVGGNRSEPVRIDCVAQKNKAGRGLRIVAYTVWTGQSGKTSKRSQSSGGLTEGREGAIQTPREGHATDREGEKCKGLEVRMSLVCV